MLPGFAIYTSHRLEDLLEVLAARIAHDPLPPLIDETILVPGQGLARWLRLQLADRLGIAAGLAMPFPGAFLQELVRAAVPGQRDPFAPDVLVWRIHRLLTSPPLRQDLSLAAHYCDDDPDGRKRFQLSQRLAACFDDYQLYRPDLLERIADGDDLPELGPHARWQSRLWRALVQDANGEAGATVAHRLGRIEQLLGDEARAGSALPPRLSVFGSATLPPALVRLLLRVARRIPVTLYVPTPTPSYFGDQHRRAMHDESAPANALLARLGTEAREFQNLLVDLEAAPAGSGPAGTGIAWHDIAPSPDEAPPGESPTDLLTCLQQDLAKVREHGSSPDLPPMTLAAHDASVRVHDCHSEQRELEVVRDQILAAFDEDRALQPHDVMVLVPDIERYAPFVHAVFGPVHEHLPYQVADKSPASELPVCAAVFRILQLAQGRLELPLVLQLLETPAVRRRFGLFETDLPALHDLCERAGIRWGLDAASRSSRFELPAFEQNSWREGIARMLLGIATGPVDELVLGLLPTADTTASREPTLARFLTFLEALFAEIETLQRPHPLSRWADLLDSLLTALFLPDTEDERGIAALRDAIGALRDLADRARHREPIAPIVAQDWLLHAMSRAGESHGFYGGRVTVAAMLPMRAVPVQHLFLCGLAFDSFPRRDLPDPFDLTAAARRPGDRSARLDDRQLFLDCLLAARRRLHLTYVGRSQTDDSECAPSVVLAELLETIDRTCVPAGPFASARDQVVVRHPLQPWSPRYRAGNDPRLFTYTSGEAPPERLGGEEEAPWATIPIAPLDPPATEEIPLETLLAFWQHPCRFFLRRGAGIRLPRDEHETLPTEPFELDPLDRYRLLEETLRDALAGEPRRASRSPEEVARALASGRLPAGGAGVLAYSNLDEIRQQVLGELRRLGPFTEQSVLAHGAGWSVTGEIEGKGPDALVSAFASAVKPKRLLAAWIHHLVAALARHEGADLPAESVVVFLDKTLRFGATEQADASACLAEHVGGLRCGRRAPLPFFEHASHAFARALAKAPDDRAAALAKARTAWQASPPNAPAPDRDDPHVALCMRGRDPLDEPGFADWVERIWLPALRHVEGA